MANYPPRTILNSRTAKIRKAIFDNKDVRSQEIIRQLAQQGVTINNRALNQARVRMQRDGIPVKRISRKELVRGLLKKNPDLQTREIIEMCKGKGVNGNDVKSARSELGQKAPRKRVLHARPKLSPAQIKLIEESLPILKKLIRLKLGFKGVNRDFIEEAFLELSAQLPLWVVKLRPGAKLEAFLDYKTKRALKSFWFKTISQGSGLNQMEVINGMKWRQEFHAGKSYSVIAKESNVALQEVREIVMSLEEYFNTNSLDVIPEGLV